ncbi:hypothetical protein Tco_0309850 [Tanacetum coccineum]
MLKLSLHYWHRDKYLQIKMKEAVDGLIIQRAALQGIRVDGMKQQNLLVLWRYGHKKRPRDGHMMIQETRRTDREMRLNLLLTSFNNLNGLPSPDLALNKVFDTADHESFSNMVSNLARRQDPRESFDELTDTTFGLLSILR